MTASGERDGADLRLEELVRQALLNDHRLSSQPVTVRAEHGIVSLAGVVQTFCRKEAAEETAASVEGCRGVRCELEVRPATLLADEEVDRHARAALESHAEIGDRSISVSVSAGVVTLRGTVRSEWEREVAHDAAMSARGVRRVESLLLIDPLESIEDGELSRRIELALSNTRGLAESNLKAIVSGGCLVLRGQVGALWQFEAAERAAMRFGLRGLRNEIQVDRP